MGPSIQLPAMLAIGFTGHRVLVDEAKCRGSIFGFLEQQKKSAVGSVYGVSSVAAGADLLFAESCLQLALPLCVLLPLPVEEFRKDFDESSWSRAEEVLRKAASVEVTDGHQSREECYYECGIETVQRSRLLLALWDGALTATALSARLFVEGMDVEPWQVEQFFGRLAHAQVLAVSAPVVPDFIPTAAGVEDLNDVVPTLRGDLLISKSEASRR